MATTEIKPPTTAELRAKLTERSVKLGELRAAPADKRDGTWETDVRQTVLEIQSWDAEHKVAELREAAAAAEAEAEARAAAEKEQSKGPAAGMLDLEGRDARTLGEHIAGGEQYRAWKEAGANYRDFQFELNTRESRTLITSSTSDTPAAGVLRPLGQPIAPMPRQRRLFIRDLLASGETTLASIPYVREVTPATNETAATAVPEGGAKPEATMQFATVNGVVYKIAAWVPATMEILEDAPTLRSYIDNRLVYMVAVREEADLISGSDSGANPTLPGIAGTSTICTDAQEQSALQSDSVNDYPKTLGTAIGKVENVDGAADGIAMNPVDYWAMFTTRWGTAGQSHDSGSPFAGPPGTVWGLPVVRTRALSSSAAIVADWGAGGQVFDRMQTVVRTSDSHDDYFVKNKVAILAEKREAVCWYRPDFFVICDLTA